jgi:hypothetical protein
MQLGHKRCNRNNQKIFEIGFRGFSILGFWMVGYSAGCTVRAFATPRAAQALEPREGAAAPQGVSDLIRFRPRLRIE